MVTVRVPASTANVVPGFDCLGIALNMYNTAEFELTDGGLEIDITDSAPYIPVDENNYVYVGFKKVFDEAGKHFDGVRIRLKSDIPVTRGLGSSSASIVLGLMGANRILNDRFTPEELLFMAYEIEGHPDNVAPAIFGGFTVAVPERRRVVCSKTDVPSDITFAAMIPDFYFATKKSRGILPKYVPFRSASYNVAHAALLTAAFTKGDYDLLRCAVRDRLHQKCRFSKIRSGEYIIRSARRFGAVCGYLSGAGPTVIAIVDREPELFEKQMNNLIKANLSGWSLKLLKADNDGAVYIE